VPHDELEQLLQTADASAAAPPTLTDLPHRIRRRHQRRRTMKTVAVAVAAIALVALPLLAMSVFNRRPPSPTVAVFIERPRVPTRADLAQLDLQAQLHEQTADRLLAATSFAHAQSDPPPATDDVILRHVREQRDQAALILVYDADQAVRAKQTDRALAAYRRTIELFPKTYWAAIARQRLKEMPT